MLAEVGELLLGLPFWVAVLRIATPLVLGTLGVLLCERAGVLNLGIEGIMVAGAFAGWLTVYAGGGGHRHAAPQRQPGMHGQPAGEGAGDHDAFDAQVQHPGAFAQQHTERAQDQRRGDAQHAGPEGRRGEQIEQFVHVRTRAVGSA